MSFPRRLIVLRHAKAEPYGDSDFTRPLTARGAADAEDAGRHLAQSGIDPDLAVVSPAARTVSTWERVASALGSEPRVLVDESVYGGSVDVALDVLRQLPESAATVVIVGHNPTASYLAHLLDDGVGEPAASSALLQGFPPAAFALFEVSVPWADLAAESGRLVDFYVGRSSG